MRLALGWIYLYAGISAFLKPDWTSKGYLMAAKTLPDFYHYLASSPLLPYVDLLNKWSLLLLGISLIAGIFVRISAPLGMVLMLLYYIPILQFPYPNTHSFIVDEHVVYSAILLHLATMNAGKFYGLDRLLSKKLPEA